MASVQLENVRKVYPGGVVAVKGASLDIADEEFVVLVGPSGCGKSTLLRLVAGLEELTAGTIRIGERVVNQVSPKDRDIAMVFQNYALYPHMSVFKNMAFALKLRKYPKAEIKQRVEATADLLSIRELLDRKPKALSGGQRQRVALGRAIVRDPAVFLFDEPLSNLDAQLRVQMRAEIGKLHARLKTTMIYVTHDQVEAMTMGDRIVVMYQGEIQQVDAPLDLYARPRNKFVAGFIGSPPMNFLQGRIDASNGSLRFVATSGARDFLEIDARHSEMLGQYAGKDVILGVRPEDLIENLTQQPIPGRSLRADVEVVEPMGHETYVYLRAGESPMVARLPAGVTPPAMGTAAHVVDVAMPKAHFFDVISGLSIG